MKNLSNTKALFPLFSKGISLNLFKESDITPQYVSWLNNPDIVKYSNQRFKQHSVQSCLEYFHSFDTSDAIFLSIKEENSDCMIGTMTVYFNRHHKTADIGIMIGHQKFWGQGIGYKAWILLLNTLLETVNVRKVTGGTLSCNTSMLRIMEKSGMTQDGVRKAQEIVDGCTYDIVHFSAFLK